MNLESDERLPSKGGRPKPDVVYREAEGALQQIASAVEGTLRADPDRDTGAAIVHLNQSKKQRPILICDEAQLLRHPALEQLLLLLNFDMDSSHYLTLLLVGEPLVRRTLSLQMHEPLRQRTAVQYHLDGLSREELDAYLNHQLKAAGVAQPLLDETARQAPLPKPPRHSAQGQQTGPDGSPAGG